MPINYPPPFQGFESKVGRNSPRYGLIGNSIAAQCMPGYSAALSYEHYSFLHWALTRGGYPMRPAFVGGRTTLPSTAIIGDGIYGNSGAPSTTIAGDLAAYFTAAGQIDIMHVCCMENDTNPANEAAYKAAYDSIIQQSLNAGAKFIYWVQYLPNTGISSAALYWRLIKYIEEKAATVPQLRVVPTYDLYANTGTTVGAAPVPANAGLFANYTDGTVHPRKAGQYIGERLASLWALDGFTYAKRCPFSGNSAASTVGAAGFLGAAGTFFAVGGSLSGFTGTAPPSGLTLSNNLVAPTTATAVAARFQGRPSLQVDIASLAQASLLNAFQLLTGLLTANFTPGDVCQFFFELAFDSAVPMTGIRGLNLELRGAGTVFSSFGMRHISGDAYNEDIPQGVPLMYATPEIIVPGGTTSLRPLATMLCDNANAVAARMHFLRFGVVNHSVSG